MARNGQPHILRLRSDLKKRLIEEAQARNVEPVWLANRLIQEGLEHLRPVEEFRLICPPESEKQ